MRKVLIIIFILFISMLLSPVLITIFSQNTQQKDITISKDSQSTNLKDKTIFSVMNLTDNDFCDEGLKAVIAIAKNNIIFDNNIENTVNTENEDIDEKSYQKLEKLYEESDINLTYKNKTVYIPSSSLSSGATKASEEYPYILSVASPWDCECGDFVYEKDYSSGISIYGINYLCSQGVSAQDALRWYLPNFDIK